MAGLSAQEELILLRKRARRRLVGAVVLVLVATLVLWKVVGRVQEQPSMRPESVLVVGVASAPVNARTPASGPRVSSAPSTASQPQTTALPESLSTLSQPVPAQDLARAEGSAAAHKRPPVDASAAVHHKSETKPAKPKADRAAAPDSAQVKPKAKPKKEPDPAAILEGRADTTTDTAPDAATSVHKYVIQLAALSDPAKADALRGKLSDLGVQARFSKVQTSKGDVTRVRVGPFSSRDAANAVLRKLANAGVSGIVMGVPAQ
jgi:DedD protein